MQHRSRTWVVRIGTAVVLLAGGALAGPAQAGRAVVHGPAAATSPVAAVAHGTPARRAERGVVGNMRRSEADRRDVTSTGHSARGARAVPLGTATQSLTIDPGTGTAYVSSDDGTVSVVDVGHCNISHSGSCKAPIAELPGPVEGIGLATYRNTLYVSSGISGTNGVISVYDISSCHAGDVTGCAAAVGTVPVADIPVGLVLDSSTGTLFVGNTAAHIDVLALASCRAGQVSGCGSADVGSIPAKDGPVSPTLDAHNSTLYVPANGQDGDGSGSSVHVIDIRHCHAGDTSGCAAGEMTLPAGAGALTAFVDNGTGTLYVGNQNEGTVSVLDIRTCTGAEHAGCAQKPTDVPVGANPSGGIVETHDGRLYVANSDSDTLSTFATGRCRAGHTKGCPTSPPPTARADGAPFGLAYVSSTATIYTVENAGRALGVLSAGVCSKGHGCRTLLPSIAGNEQQLADDAVHTWYGVDAKGNLTLTDTRTCTAQHPGRCVAAAVHTKRPNTSFGSLVADDKTHSLYLISNNLKTGRGSVIVLDTRTCNAKVHTDCKPVAAPMRLPNYTAQIAINQKTDTVYVVTQYDSSLQVIDGTRCNAVHHTKCSAPAGAVPLDGVAFGIAVDPSTKTVYVSEFGNFDSDVVYAVDSTHCHSTDVTGCGKALKKFTTGLAPLGLVVDRAHHTLYVLANGGGAHDGQLDVVNTRTCSARGVVGCKPKAAFDVGRAPFVGALDPVTHHLFVADFEHAAITVLDTATCNVTNTAGCHDRQFDIGDVPGQVAIDPATHSVFALAAQYTRTYVLDTRLKKG